MALKKLLTDLEIGVNAYPNHNTPDNVGGFNYGGSVSFFDTQTFNQTSFKFNQGIAFDQLGGFSDEPYITNFNTDMNSSVPNSLVRGGTSAAINRRLDDVSRITKFLISPKGLAFTARQTGLQLSNPRMDGHQFANAGDIIGNVFSGDFSGAFDSIKSNIVGSVANQRTYNPLNLNLLSQIGAQGTGLHIKREGLLPTATKGYIDADGSDSLDGPNLFADFSRTGGNTNRMLRLFENIVEGEEQQEQREPETGFGRFIQNAQNTIKKTSEFLFGKKKHLGTLYDYAGGPGSVYGIGKTTIRRYTATGLDKTGNHLTRIGDLYDNSSLILTTSNFHINYLFRLGKPHYPYHAVTADGQERKVVREERIGLGNPGVGVDRSDEGRPDTYIQQRLPGTNILNYNHMTDIRKRMDKINLIDVYKSGTGDYAPHTRDLIKFRFEAVDTDNPNQSDVMVFRAFLDSFQDNFNATHNEYQYNGRGEVFYTYNSFKRGVNIGFKIAAQTRWEMMPLYRKLNYLASNVAPEYGETGRMRTPFMKVTVGSYLSRVPGILNSLTITWQKDYPWEISLDSPEQGMDKHMLVLPHVLDVQCTFTPVHNFLPQKSIHAPFILPHVNDNSHLDNLQKYYAVGVAQSPEEATATGWMKLSRMFDRNQTPTTLEPIQVTSIENDMSNELPPIRPLEPTTPASLAHLIDRPEPKATVTVEPIIMTSFGEGDLTGIIDESNQIANQVGSQTFTE